MDSKEIIESRDNLRTKLEEDIKINKKKNEQIGKIVFYKDFELINKTKTHLGLIENEVFIVTRNIYDGDNNKISLYEIYDENQILLAKTDKEGKLIYEESYKEKLKKNFGKFYEDSGIEERDSYLLRKREFLVGDKPYEKLNEKEKETIVKKAENQKDKKVDEKELDNPEIARKDLHYEGNAMLIYSKKEGKFVIGGMVNGHFEKSKYIEPSMSTMKTSIDLDNNGNPVERDNIHGVMQIKNNPNYAYSIDIETTGYIEFQELRIDRSKNPVEYVSADLETTRQYRSSKEVEYAMRRDTNHEISDEVDDFNRAEQEDQKVDLDDMGDRDKEEERDEMYEDYYERRRGRIR